MKNFMCLLFGSFLWCSPSLYSQDYQLQEHWWGPGGILNDFIKDDQNGILYLCGNFEVVGPPLQCGTIVSTTDGMPDASMPFPTNPGNTIIWAAIPDGEGGWYIGGSFSELAFQSRNNIAHINSQGELSDLNINITAEVETPTVRTLRLSNDGNILYFGGTFSHVNDSSRINIAAYDLENNELLSWNPSVGAIGTFQWFVNDIKITQSDSIVFVGGSFIEVGGEEQRHLAALDAFSGELLPFLNLHFNDAVRSLVLDEQSNQIYVGGQFSQVENVNTGRLVRIDLNSGNVIPWSINVNSTVMSMEINSNNNILYLGGFFSNISGTQRAGLAAINPSSGTLLGFEASIPQGVESIALSQDDSILYVGGMFRHINNEARVRLGAIQTSNSQLTDWTPGANGTIFCMHLSEDGESLYIGGQYRRIGKTRRGLAAIDMATGLATDWDPNENMDFMQAPPAYNSLAINFEDSTLYVSGLFSKIGEGTRNNIAALDLYTGDLKDWVPEVFGNILGSYYSMQNNRLYISGFFTSINGQNRNRLAAFDMPSGELSDWNPNANNAVAGIYPSHDDSLMFVRGGFSQIGGVNVNNLTSLDALTGEPTGWAPSPNGGVFSFALPQQGNTIFIGGNFSTIGGQFRKGVAEIDLSTGLATAWDADLTRPNFNPEAAALLLIEEDSFLVIGGNFNEIGGQEREHFGVVSTSTGIPTDFAPSFSTSFQGNNSFIFSSFINGFILITNSLFIDSLYHPTLAAFISTACPGLLTAPEDVLIVNSNCSSDCTISGGSFSNPPQLCPPGSTPQYQVDGGSWEFTLPAYNQNGPAQTIKTRCICSFDFGVISPESDGVTTNPGGCEFPSAPELIILDGDCTGSGGSITATGCSSGSFPQYALNSDGPWQNEPPEYTADSFEVFVRCVDSMTQCPSSVITGMTQPGECFDFDLAGNIQTTFGVNIDLVELLIEGDFQDTVFTDTDGNYELVAGAGTDFTVIPVKNTNWLDGVTTLDIIITQQHLIQLNTFDNPYLFIAADANDDGQVSTIDLIFIQQLIIGLNDSIPGNTSWRFVPEDFEFDDPDDPLAEDWPETKEYMDLNVNLLSENWVAVKVGDVSGDAGQSGMRYQKPKITFLTELEKQADDRVAIIIKAKEAISLTGYQMEWTYNSTKMEFAGVDFSNSELDFSIPEMVFSSEGLIRTNWWNGMGHELDPESELFRLYFQLHDININLKEELKLLSHGERWHSELYGPNPNYIYDIELEWPLEMSLKGGFELFQNIPNPFGNYTTIQFKLPEDSPIIIDLLNASGKLVRSHNLNGEGGLNSFTMTMENLPQGVYYYRVSSEDWTATRKMIYTGSN